MSNFSGNWKIIRSENFEEMLKALGKEVIPASRRAGGRGRVSRDRHKKERGTWPRGCVCGGGGNREPISPRKRAGLLSPSWGSMARVPTEQYQPQL